MGKGKKFLIGIVVLFIVMLAVWQVFKIMTSAEPLTKEEATQKVQELYAGDIVAVQEDSNRYLITIELETGTYEIEIDRDSGDIGSVIRTKKVAIGNEPVPENQDEPVDDATNESEQSNEGETAKDQGTPPASVDETENNSEGAKQLTEKEAIEIALSQLDGEVDDIDLERSGDVLYYLVDIEREGAEDEATIKINAISGEVMSVIWDD